MYPVKLIPCVSMQCIINFWILSYLFQNIFAGAIGPPSGVLTWVILMTENWQGTHIMRRALAEIRAGISKQAKVLSFSDIEKFSYLKMVIIKTLRLHPLVPLLTRESRTASQILKYKNPRKHESHQHIRHWTRS